MIDLIDSIKKVKPTVIPIAFKRHNPLTNLDERSIVGSGFIFSKEKLLVCTCAHVVAPNGVIRTDAQLEVGITINKDTIVGCLAQIVSIDYKKDLAVLQIITTDQNVLNNISEVKMGSSSNLEEGTEVAFIGFPFGMSLSADITSSSTRGIVSALRRNLSNKEVEFIQLDAIVGGGNSGAPVFLPSNGEIVAVIKSRFDPLMKGRAPRLIIDGEPLEIFTNIGFAQPIDMTKDFLLSTMK